MTPPHRLPRATALPGFVAERTEVRRVHDVLIP